MYANDGLKKAMAGDLKGFVRRKFMLEGYSAR